MYRRNYDRRFYQGIINNSNIEIISGIFRKDASKEIYNSIVLLNKTEQFYDKRKLVPFGEYTPLNFFFNPIAEALNIPMSSLSHGLENQQNLILSNKIIVYPLICYESAYPGLLKIKDDRFGFILNLSNDGWFGKSFAPHQHLQIAQSRALETGYPVIRAANTGITAVINGNGVIEGRINLDEEGYLNMDIYPVKGITYYMYFGDYPILMLIFTIMLIYWKQLNRYE